MYYSESNVIVTHLCLQPNMSTADRKKKNFSFSRKFPFMKSKDNIGSQEELSTDERKLKTVVERSLKQPRSFHMDKHKSHICSQLTYSWMK